MGSLQLLRPKGNKHTPGSHYKLSSENQTAEILQHLEEDCRTLMDGSRGDNGIHLGYGARISDE